MGSSFNASRTLNHRLRADARSIFEAGVRAADPHEAVGRNLRISDTGRPTIAGEELATGSTLRIVAFGKAGVIMARAAAEALSESGYAPPGIVSVNRENHADFHGFRVFGARHPIPDAVGVAAAEATREYVAGSRGQDALLVLLSGGGSALLPSPAPGVSLEDKQETTRLLLASGAPIQAVNCVRKHLSTIKGGGLARQAWPARIESLILSDVIGNDLGSIASGPTAPDPSTFVDALQVLTRYGLLDSIPQSVKRRLENGVDGEIPETPTEEDPMFTRIENRLVGSNLQSLAAAERSAAALGFAVFVASTGLVGEARTAASEILTAAQRHWDGRSPLAVLFGGETTVTVRGSGQGGRNQETALALALLSEQRPLPGHWVFLSGGTDGVDGPTDAAGGVVDAETPERIRRAGFDPAFELNQNNSHAVLTAADDLLMTGPTGTNVADLQILLLSAAAPGG